MANDVRVTLGMDTKQADDALKKYQMNVKKAGLALSAIGAAGGLAIKKFTSAALEQEKALAGVLNSARNTGEAMAGFEDKVLSATAALQNKTNFGDEEQHQQQKEEQHEREKDRMTHQAIRSAESLTCFFVLRGRRHEQ